MVIINNQFHTTTYQSSSRQHPIKVHHPIRSDPRHHEQHSGEGYIFLYLQRSILPHRHCNRYIDNWIIYESDPSHIITS